MWNTACRKRIHGFIDSTAAYIYRMSSSFYFGFGLTNVVLKYGQNLVLFPSILKINEGEVVALRVWE